jgi:hypothetical protein
MELRNWITEFLQQREKMKSPDERSLYAYRMSVDEYRELHQELANAARYRQMVCLVKNPFFCGALVLYAAEWWRREYQGGAWRWDDILKSLGIGGIQFYQQKSVVVKGMRFWRLPLAEGGKQYFGSIVAQGGLPLFALKSKGGATLGKAMNTVLRDANRYRWDEAQIVKAVENEAKTPPKFAESLQNQAFYDLIAQIVCAVLRLKREYNLEKITEPIAKLDALYPGWKNEFPLSLDDEMAKHLLDSLVKTANEARTISRRALFSVERRLLARCKQQFELQSTIVCPGKPVSGNELATFAGLQDAKRLPGYVVFDADVDRRSQLAHARSSLGEADQCFTVKAAVRHWFGMDACLVHKLVLHSNNQDLHPKPIALPGGDALCLDTPWVFSAEEDGFVLTATGDVRLSMQEILVTVAENWEIDSDGEISDAGVLHLDSRTTIALKRLTTGTVRIRSVEDEWVIAVGVTSHASVNYELHGAQAPLKANVPIFRKIPKVVFYDDSGERHDVLQKDLRLSRVGSIEILAAGCTPSPGLLTLTVEQDGKRMKCFRFAVIEPDSREVWKSGDTPLEGDITLFGWGAFSLACKHGDVAIKETITGGFRKLHMSVAEQPPACVDVFCKWPGSTGQLLLSLPFPATGGHAYDENGKQMANGCVISLNCLLGKRVFVFDSNPNFPKNYALKLQLKAVGLSLPCRAYVITLDDGRAEISLANYREAIEALLALSDHLDAKVAVTLYAGQQSVLTLNVVRYDAELFIQGGCAVFSDAFIGTLSSDELTALEVLAVPLANPNEASKLWQNRSSGVPTGTWQIDHLLPNTPWLLVPPEQAKVSFRAAIVDVPPDIIIEDEKLCELAVAMQHSDAGERERAIYSALENMAENFNHPSWEFLGQLWQSLRHLPLCSLDVFRLLARRPDLAINLLFVPYECKEIAERLHNELGLMLEIVPISTWRKSVGNLCSYWHQKIGECASDSVKDMLCSILNNRFDELRGLFSNHSLFLDILQEETAGDKQTNLDKLHDTNPEAIGHALWQGVDALVQTYLLRVHADARWPEPTVEKGRDLKAWLEPLRMTLKKDARRMKILHDYAVIIFWDCDDSKNIAANIPAICALWATCDLDGTWWRKPGHLNALRQLRAFDTAWFDECYRQSLSSCFTLGLLK